MIVSLIDSVALGHLYTARIFSFLILRLWVVVAFSDSLFALTSHPPKVKPLVQGLLLCWLSSSIFCKWSSSLRFCWRSLSSWTWSVSIKEWAVERSWPLDSVSSTFACAAAGTRCVRLWRENTLAPARELWSSTPCLATVENNVTDKQRWEIESQS